MKKKIIISVIIILLLLLLIGGFILYRYTDVFGKKALPTKIDSISIQYVPGMSLNKTDKYNSEHEKMIEIQSIKLDKKQKNNFYNLFLDVKEGKKIKKVKDYDYIRVVVNKDVILYINDKDSAVQWNKKLYKVNIPNSLYNEVLSIIEKNNKKILDNFTFENITVSDAKSIIKIENEDNIKTFKDFLYYYPISLDEDYNLFNDGYKYIITLDNSIKIYLYDDNIAYYVNTSEEEVKSSYIIFSNDMYDFIKLLYEVTESNKKEQ